MFSKNKISDQDQKTTDTSRPGAAGASSATAPSTGVGSGGTGASSGLAAPRSKPSPSLLSSDLMVKGNVITTGDIQVEGTVEGDVRAHLLTVGESATIRGEVIADDVVVNGRVVGRLRGLKVRLTQTSRVEGDIVHKTIAIESGAHFEGSVQRHEDPLGDGSSSKKGDEPTRVADTIATGATSSATGGSSASMGSGAMETAKADGSTSD